MNSTSPGEPAVSGDGVTRDGHGSESAPARDWIRLRRGLVGSGVFLVVWWLAALTQPTYLLPGPVEVAFAFLGELQATATYTVPLVGADETFPRLVAKLLESLQHYVPGLVLGATLGIATGVATGWSTRLSDALSPLVRVLRPIPPLAWIAFAIVWFGVGNAGATFIVAIGAFWVNYYNTESGVESVPADRLEVAASLGVGPEVG